MKEIKINYVSFKKDSKLSVLVDAALFQKMYTNGSLKQKCDYARWLVSNSGWFNPNEFSSYKVEHFEIEGINLLDFANLKWLDGSDLNRF